MLDAQTERDRRRTAQLSDELEQKLTSMLAAQTDRLEQKLSSVLEAQTERDRRTAQQTDELERKLSAVLFAQTEGDRRTARLTEELPELQATLDTKLDKLLQSRDHALEQAQSALEKATSRAAEGNEQTRRELAEVRAELEARKSEMTAVHLRLKDAEIGSAKSRAEPDIPRGKFEANFVHMDEDRIIRRLTAMEAEIASLRQNEKSFEMMECSNEG